MLNKLCLLLCTMMAIFIFTACQKQIIIKEKLSCPNNTNTKKVAKKQIFNMNTELKVLLSKTNNLAQYEMKTETNLD